MIQSVLKNNMADSAHLSPRPSCLVRFTLPVNTDRDRNTVTLRRAYLSVHCHPDSTLAVT